jgi:hypothetical protein
MLQEYLKVLNSYEIPFKKITQKLVVFHVINVHPVLSLGTRTLPVCDYFMIFHASVLPFPLQKVV